MDGEMNEWTQDIFSNCETHNVSFPLILSCIEIIQHKFLLACESDNVGDKKSNFVVHGNVQRGKWEKCRVCVQLSRAHIHRYIKKTFELELKRDKMERNEDFMGICSSLSNIFSFVNINFVSQRERSLSVEGKLQIMWNKYI